MTMTFEYQYLIYIYIYEVYMRYNAEFVGLYE